MKMKLPFLLFALVLAGCATQEGVFDLSNPFRSSDTSPDLELASSIQPELTPVQSIDTLTTLRESDELAPLINGASGVVLVDFYADWCGPCRTMGEILKDMKMTASQNGASIVKVNVDQHRELASQFGVASLPTMLVFKDGKMIDRQVGLTDKKRIASLLTR